MSRKLGKFYIDSGLLNETELLHKAFGKIQFVPYKAEYRYDIMALELIGLSPMFDELPEGVEVPLYQMAMVDGDDPHVAMLKADKRLIGEAK